MINLEQAYGRISLLNVPGAKIAGPIPNWDDAPTIRRRTHWPLFTNRSPFPVITKTLPQHCLLVLGVSPKPSTINTPCPQTSLSPLSLALPRLLPGSLLLNPSTLCWNGPRDSASMLVYQDLLTGTVASLSDSPFCLNRGLSCFKHLTCFRSVCCLSSFISEGLFSLLACYCICLVFVVAYVLRSGGFTYRFKLNKFM